MRQIAFWITKDRKHWLKLSEGSHGSLRCYRVEGSYGEGNLGKISLLDALKHAEDILSHWPSKAIRYH